VTADTWRSNEGRVEGTPREYLACRCSVSDIFHRSLADSFNLEKRGTLPPIPLARCRTGLPQVRGVRQAACRIVRGSRRWCRGHASRTTEKSLPGSRPAGSFFITHHSRQNLGRETSLLLRGSPASQPTASMWKLVVAALLWFAVVAYAKVEKDVSKLQIGVKVWTHRREKSSSSVTVDVNSLRRRRLATPIDDATCHSSHVDGSGEWIVVFGWAGGRIFVSR
jgi:hypothetical protein